MEWQIGQPVIMYGTTITISKGISKCFIFGIKITVQDASWAKGNEVSGRRGMVSSGKSLRWW